MKRDGFLRLAAAGILCVALGTGPALAAGSSDDDAPAKNPDYTQAVKLIDAKKYAQALPLLKRAEAKEPKNADVHNYLGYANRKLKNFDVAMKHYKTALSIKPKHRGANEYIGELYLELGQLAKAEQHLKVLDDACFFGCSEYTDLKKAIAAYKARNGKGS